VKKKKIKTGLALALACLVLVSLVACGQEDESQPQIVEVSRGDVMVTVGADGNLSLIQHRKLAFGTAGTVAEVNVEEGDRVTEGQVLARLDTGSLERAVKAAELAVKAAEIDLELATNDFRKITYPYTYSTFVFDVPEALVDISDAERQIGEAQDGLEIGLSSDQYWEVWLKLSQAQDNLVEAKSRLARGRGEDVFISGIIPITDYWTLRTAQLGMEKAQLALDLAKNDLDKANEELDKAVIVAPFDGVIAKADGKPGDVLSAMNYATMVIVELIDPSRMELTVEVDEIDIAGVKLGQRAIIDLDALPDVQVGGEVTSISLLSTEEAGLIMYEADVRFDVPEGIALKAGMTANADIIIDERSDVLLVPDRAIKQDDQGEPVVQVVVGDQIEARAVVIGISDGFQTEIVDGLDEGEMVVVEIRAKTQAGGIFGG